tara:strand:+ start:2524 stop:2673 length:150 start_codon:yes stop_codon:yes gene_type:complete
VIDDRKFDELVENTTRYLQLLMDKNEALEKRLEALETKKTISRSKADDK